MGNDTLISNTGNDRLYGGYGNDKYIYTKGSGSDTIQDNGGNDTLVLKGISQDETKFEKVGKDLIISFTNSDDTIAIKDHFKWILGKPNKLENIIFDKDENLQINQIDEFINGKWNKMTYNDLSRKFETNVSESVAPLTNYSKGANLVNSQICEFANSSKSINSSPFISQNQIDKIIEQVSTYNSDTGFGNFAFDDMKGAMNLQIYG